MQEKLIESMMLPETYPHQISEIRKAETHTAWVFLTGERAYKIKKPVNFGFLDFSTLEKRKLYCEKEIELNSEISDLYIGVQPLTSDAEGKITLGGDGEVIEYAVVMKELPQEAMMSRLLGQGKIGYEVVNKLARETARFHKIAATSAEITSQGSLDSVRFNWEENFAQTEGVREETISTETFDFIKAQIEKFLDARSDQFRKREKDGFIRYCHGDLHSGNIFFHQDKIYIFDRIEFNLRFACSDTVADLAFMTMDLDFHGNRNLSDFLLDRYLEESGDYAALRFHDFFRCYRAYVRGKVIGFQLAQNPPDPEGIKNQARAYFDLAKGYASTLFSKPRLIVFYGLPGTGKTLFSSRTRDMINAVHVRSDVVRRVISGVSLDEHHYAFYGDDLYSKSISDRVYDTLKRKATSYLKQGQSLILDATYNRANERDQLKALARDLGTEVHFIKCQADDEKVREWIARRRSKDLQSDATWEIYSQMKDKFEPEAGHDHHLLDTGRSDKEIYADIRAFLDVE